jgi:hypothetical protein
MPFVITQLEMLVNALDTRSASYAAAEAANALAAG